MSAIEDIYPLTPLQSGMLYHSLLEPDRDLYVDQVVVDLRTRTPVDPGRFREAWRQVLRRHPALRTVFSYDQGNKLRQVVLRDVPCRIAFESWEGPDGELGGRLEAFLREDRRAGVDLTEPPLVRVALVSRPPDRSTLARSTLLRSTLVLTYHHALVDAWSVSLLLKETLALYAGGDPARLPAARPYRDFVAWVQNAAPPIDEAFWREAFDGFDGATRLPDVLPGPPADSHGAPERLRLGAAESAAVDAAARRWRTTPAVLAQAAWAIVASRYTGQRETLFGTTFSGRTVPVDGVGQMIGLFTSTLPMRVRVDPGMTLQDLAARIAARQAALLRHEQTPVQAIQRVLSLEPGTNLFEVVFAFENVLEVGHPREDDGGALETAGSEYRCRTNYPLNVMVVPTAPLELGMHYDSRVYSRASVRQMLGHLRNALGAFALEGRRVGDVDLLSPAEHARAVTSWNRTAAPLPVRMVPALVSDAAERRPTALAVSAEGEAITYADLERRSNRLAHWLRGRGAGPERFVAICLDRTVEMVVAVLASLKSGAAYVPLDPVYPPERLAFMAGDCRPAVLLTDARLAARIPGGTPTVLDAMRGEIDACPADPPQVAIDPLTTAYVIYTSGSTGRPKGTLLTHGGLANMILDWNRLFEVGEESRVLQFASFSFDASVWEIASALVAGATLCLGSRSTLYSADDLLAMLRGHAITCALLPPSLLSVLPADGVPDLRSIAAIGEKCTADIARRWAPGRLFVNAYGPAEGTITVSTYRVQGEAEASDPPIGRPMANLQLYVLDDEGRPAPVGVPGELHLGGVGLARGYLHEPALTAATFVPDPFSAAPGERLYRTGDRARYREDGNVEFIGRIDHQVKVRGCRVEPGEVESALRHVPGVRAAVVLPAAGPGDGVRLVAYLLADAAPPSTAGLREALARRLPAYMIPAAFVYLERFPVTPNGKIDRAALPAPDWSAGAEESGGDEPRTGTERALVESWREVLGVPGIGIHTNFFDAGGDSIASIRIVAAARQRGVHVTAAQMMQHETIAALAAVATAAAASATAAEETRPVALTPIQRWFFGRSFANPHHYNQAIVLELLPSIPADAVEPVLRAVVQGHEAFRLRFSRAGEAWQQRVGAEGRISYARIPLRGLPADERWRRFREHADRCQQAFDVEAGPTAGAALFELDAPSPHLLLVAAHHLAVDVYSWRTIVGELEAAFARALAGQEPRVPAEAAGYSAWSAFVGSEACADLVRERMPHLRSLLLEMEGVDPSPIGPAGTYGSMASVEIALTPEETGCVARPPKAAHAPRRSLDVALLSSLCDALLAASGRTSVVVAVERDSRAGLSHPLDLGRTAGWFTSIFPVLLEAGSDERALQRRVDLGIWLPLLPAVSPDAPGVPAPSISYTHLGDLAELSRGGLVKLSLQDPGALHDPRNERPFAWELVSFLHGGRLHLRAMFDGRAAERARVDAALAGWRASLRSRMATA